LKLCGTESSKLSLILGLGHLARGVDCRVVQGNILLKESRGAPLAAA
jgi:hypothetical protein